MGQARVIRHSCRVKIDEGDPRAGSTHCTLEYTLLHNQTSALLHCLTRVWVQFRAQPAPRRNANVFFHKRSQDRPLQCGELWSLNLWPTTRERASWLGVFLTAESKVLSVPTIWNPCVIQTPIPSIVLFWCIINCFAWILIIRKFLQKKVFYILFATIQSQWCCYAIDCIRTGKQTTDPARVDRSSHCTGWIYTITLFTTTHREHKDMKCDWNDKRF